MSAIQEALERVRKEREASRQEDLSWVESVARPLPCEVNRRLRPGLRLSMLVLAGAAIGVTMSQVSWNGFHSAGTLLNILGKETHLSLSKKLHGALQEGELPKPTEQQALAPREDQQVPPEKRSRTTLAELRETLARARTLRQDGDLLGAERELIGFLHKEPNTVEALVALADLYVKDISSASRAIELYHRAIQVSPQRASLWVNLGVAYMRAGDLAVAEEKLRTALELDPSVAEAHYNMACALALQGNKQEALGFLERAASLDSHVFEWAKQDQDLVSLRDAFPGKLQLP